ncbi:MAG: hypothetical protein IJX52_01460 [Oscillibacter sp.]|nr:hypothetical protein [Oscillibacter sp.]
MTKDNIFITLPPQQLPALQGWDVTPAHLAYRVGKGPHLFRAGGTPPPKGGLMVLDNHGFDGRGPIAPFCQEVVRECLARGFCGAVLEFEGRRPPLEQIADHLDNLFARRSWLLFVPEGYGLCATHAKVMISSALSGGSLALRLEECVQRFGRDRVVLALEKTAEDFFLPSPSGKGIPLTQEELKERMARLHPSVFFSQELCARYFTYMSRDNGAHFVLFDDGDTLRRKLEVARGQGITTFLAPWAEVADCADHLGFPRHPSGRRGC